MKKSVKDRLQRFLKLWGMFFVAVILGLVLSNIEITFSVCALCAVITFWFAAAAAMIQRSERCG